MIVLDMDGVLVNFCKGAYEAHGRQWDESLPTMFDFFEEWGMTADEFWAPINELGAEWWAELPLFPWAEELIETCRSFDQDCIVATASSHHGYSAAGKVAALQKLFGPKFRDYFITPKKWLLGAEDRILIDDLDTNCNGFIDHGGEAVLFPQPWNVNADLCDDRLGFVKHELTYILKESVL